MKFPAEIDNQKTIKKGMKITLMVEKDDMIEVMKNLHKFIDKPVKKLLEVRKWISRL